eukprot:ctg_3782.g611
MHRGARTQSERRRGQQTVRAGHGAFPGVHHQETAGTVGTLGGAYMQARLAHHGGVLIAQHARDGQPAVPGAAGAAQGAVHLGAAADARQTRLGNAERLQQLRVPALPLQIHQQRAAGVGHVGHVRALLGQSVQQPRVHRPEQGATRQDGVAHRRIVIHQPFQFDARKHRPPRPSTPDTFPACEYPTTPAPGATAGRSRDPTPRWSRAGWRCPPPSPTPPRCPPRTPYRIPLGCTPVPAPVSLRRRARSSPAAGSTGGALVDATRPRWRRSCRTRWPESRWCPDPVPAHNKAQWKRRRLRQATRAERPPRPTGWGALGEGAVARRQPHRWAARNGPVGPLPSSDSSPSRSVAIQGHALRRYRAVRVISGEKTGHRLGVRRVRRARPAAVRRPTGVRAAVCGGVVVSGGGGCGIGPVPCHAVAQYAAAGRVAHGVRGAGAAVGVAGAVVGAAGAAPGTRTGVGVLHRSGCLHGELCVDMAVGTVAPGGVRRLMVWVTLLSVRVCAVERGQPVLSLGAAATFACSVAPVHGHRRVAGVFVRAVRSAAAIGGESGGASGLRTAAVCGGRRRQARRTADTRAGQSRPSSASAHAYRCHYPETIAQGAQPRRVFHLVTFYTRTPRGRRPSPAYTSAFNGGEKARRSAAHRGGWHVGAQSPPTSTAAWRP